MSAPAGAFCRKSTDSPTDESFDPATAGSCGDKADALPLYWPDSCVEYQLTIDPDLADNGLMTEDRARAIVQAAASSWMQAECPRASGKGVLPPAIKAVDVGTGRCSGTSGSTKNEIHFTNAGPPGEALALTDVTYDLDTGRMLKATTRVFNVYDRLGNTPDEIDKGMGYVVKHEFGHFLGMAHSQYKDAVMYASYRSRQSDDLTDDDVAGICDAYNPESPIGAGCSTSAGPKDLWPLLAAGALFAVLRRRRRLATAALGVTMLAFGVPDARAADTPTVSVESLPRAPDKPTKKPTPKKRKKPTRKKKATKPKKDDADTAAAADALVTKLDDATTHKDPEPPKPEPPPPPADPPHADPPPEPPRPAMRYDSGAPEKDEPPAGSKAGSKDAAIYAGARYRAFVLPQPVFDAIGRGGKTLLFQSIGVEGDIRKGNFSIVPALTFADLSSGDMLLGSHTSDLTSSFSYVKSDLKALAASVGLAWSFPMSSSIDFELGVELGVGFTFGTLIDNWVYESSDGPLVYAGRHFTPCESANSGIGCRPQDHASPNPVKVGNYSEPSIFAGGKAPTLLPWVSLPLLGVRAQLSDELAMRVGLGASFTGVWAGAALDYAVRR